MEIVCVCVCVCVCVIRQSPGSAVITVTRPLPGRLIDIAPHFTGFSEEISGRKVGLSVRMTVFWHMRACGSGDGYRRFESGRCLHIQDDTRTVCNSEYDDGTSALHNLSVLKWK